MKRAKVIMRLTALVGLLLILLNGYLKGLDVGILLTIGIVYTVFYLVIDYIYSIIDSQLDELEQVYDKQRKPLLVEGKKE